MRRCMRPPRDGQNLWGRGGGRGGVKADDRCRAFLIEKKKKKKGQGKVTIRGTLKAMARGLGFFQWTMVEEKAKDFPGEGGRTRMWEEGKQILR